MADGDSKFGYSVLVPEIRSISILAGIVCRSHELPHLRQCLTCIQKPLLRAIQKLLVILHLTQLDLVIGPHLVRQLLDQVALDPVTGDALYQ